MPRTPPPLPTLPAPADIMAALAGLTHAEIQKLSAISGTPFHTLWNIRSGKTGNPGVATVLAFWPHIPAAKAV